MGYYLMLLADEFGNVVWVYDGSEKGVIVRVITYDNIKDAGNARNLVLKDAKGKHIRTLLQEGYSVHI